MLPRIQQFRTISLDMGNQFHKASYEKDWRKMLYLKHNLL